MIIKTNLCTYSFRNTYRRYLDFPLRIIRVTARDVMTHGEKFGTMGNKIGVTVTGTKYRDGFSDVQQTKSIVSAGAAKANFRKIIVTMFLTSR